MGDGGKGSAPRPIDDWDKFEGNWDLIFGNPKSASPCCDVCKMDESIGLCKGCYRTRDEIGGWLYMDDETRAFVNGMVEIRKTMANVEKGK